MRHRALCPDVQALAGNQARGHLGQASSGRSWRPCLCTIQGPAAIGLQSLSRFSASTQPALALAILQHAKTSTPARPVLQVSAAHADLHDLTVEPGPTACGLSYVAHLCAGACLGPTFALLLHRLTTSPCCLHDDLNKGCIQGAGAADTCKCISKLTRPRTEGQPVDVMHHMIPSQQREGPSDIHRCVYADRKSHKRAEPQQEAIVGMQQAAHPIC